MNYTDPAILVVDGHPVYSHKLRNFLEGLSFHNITVASSGKEGEAQCGTVSPALIILSGTLPDSDAAAICRALKQQQPSAKIIIQIGLFTEPEAVAQFKESGADVVLDRKEKDLMPLQQAITSLLFSSSSA